MPRSETLAKYPKVSVVIPALNSISTIQAAINSVVNQTYDILEIIVVDNGSTDGTFELLDSLKEKIKVLKCEVPGAGPARNMGVAKASGEIIAFLDSDDLWHPQKINLQIKAHFQESSANLISGGFSRFIGGSGKVVGTSIVSNDDDEVVQILNSGQMPAALSTWLIAKDTFTLLGGFNPDYVFAQDLELILRAHTQGVRVKVLREIICDYRLFSGSETNQSYIKQYLTGIYVQQSKKNGDSQSALNDFLQSEERFGKRNFRKALAGKHFRHFLVAYTASHYLHYFVAFLHLTLSIFLDPRSVWRKFCRQSKFVNRKYL